MPELYNQRIFTILFLKDIKKISVSLFVTPPKWILVEYIEFMQCFFFFNVFDMHVFYYTLFG